jgi:hypothetical protein
VSGKHFVAVAEIMNLFATDPHTDPDTVKAISQSLADVSQADNSRFDRARFLTACGMA